MNLLDKTWLEGIKQAYPQYFHDVKVLELGALDVNGSMWELFENCEMTGVDWIKGTHVTHVMKCSETDFAPGTFDVLMSFNHLEHDPFWRESIAHNLPALKDNAFIILRWATNGSSQHGPEFDPTHTGGYYPKSIYEVAKFLGEQGVKVISQSQDHNPAIGLMANIIAKWKPNDLT